MVMVVLSMPLMSERAVALSPPWADIDPYQFYFQTPNYANSPLPTVSATVSITDTAPGSGGGASAVVAGVANGAITGIMVVNGGSGYVNPVVTINTIAGGTGWGATASATVGPGGVITGITLSAGGSGYTLTGGIRKFVDSLPGLGPDNRNNLGNFIPIAVKDSTKYTGSDYYQIGLKQYNQRLHSDLPPTTLRGYADLQGDGIPHYLGPVIVAGTNKPVRLKFKNQLTPNSSFLMPVDTSYMGAGNGPDGTPYSQNRAELHLHGGYTPWISDGTPHQWVTPPGETTNYPKGVSFQNVPDMLTGTESPVDGTGTYYYTNQQSGRFMFYHDHAYGITRLNVYAGEAAGYLIHDAAEDALINSGVIPNNGGGVYNWGIPLIIQDKTFVPDSSTLAQQDPTWPLVVPGSGKGNLWFPHVYMPNQNPNDQSAMNNYGRWDYGPWFWPPLIGVAAPIHDKITINGKVVPGTPNPSGVPEGFMDTPVVNGTPYPYLNVLPRAYRFRILNAGNDRSWNLQLYQADPDGYKIADASGNEWGTEVRMVPATPNSGLPARWPTDGRSGGVPDPSLVGPDIIQIGTEGGFLPAPAIIPSTPIGYNYNRRDIIVLNVQNKGLFIGPAERADVIIDFSQSAGKTVILYNDGPAPTPAFDPRYDYYTGDPDLTSSGGAPTTIPGYGPNTRTLMQFRVAGSTPAESFNPATLNAPLAAYFQANQPTIIVPQAAYNSVYGSNISDVPGGNLSNIADTSLTFTLIGGSAQVNQPMQAKAIQELFEADYGRMNAVLGTELLLTNFTTQTTIPLAYIDPPTEVIKDGETQIWKITHNGVDTHAIHFHLFNVQLVNRVGWDGAIRHPDPNELGWKETLRMNPLEDAIVAMKPVKMQNLPFAVPDSVRLLDPTQPRGATMSFTNVNPVDGTPVTTVNDYVNFGWEYVWHCHLLGHEENDMMRPIAFEVAPSTVPVLKASAPAGITSVVNLSWAFNQGNQLTNYVIWRGTAGGAFTQIGSVTGLLTFQDNTAPLITYSYYVVATNAGGSVTSNIVSISTPALTQPAPAGLKATSTGTNFVILSWNAVNGAKGYTVQRLNGSAWTTLGTSNTTTFRITGLTSKKTYSFRVQANPGGQFSATLTLTLP